MRCTELTEPLRPGFHSGGSGGGGHGDDEDEHYTLPRSERRVTLETTVTFFDTNSSAVRSLNSSTPVIQEALPAASAFTFVV